MWTVGMRENTSNGNGNGNGNGSGSGSGSGFSLCVRWWPGNAVPRISNGGDPISFGKSFSMTGMRVFR